MKKKTTTPTSKKNHTPRAEALKLGIDIHKTKYVVVCQYDGEAPKAPQSFKPEAFLAWVAKQLKRGIK